MPSLFHTPVAQPPLVEPVRTVFPTIDGAEVAAAFVGTRIAGDFYDSVRVSPERVLIGLLDAAGQREDNRGILAAAQETFRSVGTELFSRSDINESDAMTELCLRINRRLLDVCCGVHSCPGFIACYHEKFGTLCYTNAGHTPALLRDHTGISELAPTGLPLGLFSHATCDAPTVGLGKGDAMVVVSRGVVECECRCDGNRRAEEFGLDRVNQLLRVAKATGAQALCSSVLTSVAEFSGNAPACDDRTALALVRSA